MENVSGWGQIVDSWEYGKEHSDSIKWTFY
jgi:hypothetical protein